MKKNFLKFTVMLALAAVICLPGVASADYIQNWYENGLYGSPATQKTWDKAEAFLVSGGTWTDPGLTISSGSGWTTTLINPTYALATTKTAYISNPLEYFIFTTYATNRTATEPFVFDWILWNGTTIVGFDRLTWTPAAGGGWTFAESQVLGTSQITAQSSQENRSPVPLPPTLLLLSSGLVGLCLLSGRKLSES
jgi:hypothetical protein